MKEYFNEELSIRRQDFGKHFKWGTAISAYQTEGAHDTDNKGPSIWDIFSNTKKRIASGHNANIACNFYHTFSSDIALMKTMNIQNFRFSLSWPRIMPDGISINPHGIDYYNKLIDTCFNHGIEPWITLYHWDLPHSLEEKGGWINRDVIHWFSRYVEVCVKNFGDRVRYWMVLNEPMVFTGAGYFLGVHAPGKKGLKNFIPAMHHVVLCQAEGGRILRNLAPKAEIGTTFSCSHIDPYTQSEKDRKAAEKIDALINRLYIEPALGMGYPLENLKRLQRVEKYMHANDEKSMAFDFDFIGLQNYTREVVKHSWLTPYLQASIVPAKKRNVTTTSIHWEVYPQGIYHILKKYSNYEKVKKIIITENGAAFPDKIENERVYDEDRKKYLIDYLQQVHRAKSEGVKVEGYFVWSFLDNFEWAEGYHPRFGLVYVDFETQQRIVKHSGEWYAEFLRDDR